MLGNLLGFALLLSGSSVAQISLATYNSQQLTAGYTFFWKVDPQTLHVALQTDSTGWVGVGLPEEVAGSMPGSDIVTCQLNELGEPTVVDRHADSFTLPNADTCQDWRLDDFTETGGLRTYFIHRSLDTADSQDRPIPQNSTRIIWARGASDTFSYHTERGYARLALQGSTSTASYADVENFVDFHINSAIPNAKTNYMCQSFALPQLATDHHLITVDVMLSPDTERYVHHLLLHSCEPGPGSIWDAYANTSSHTCNSPLGNVDGGCGTLIFGWAVGGRNLSLPAAAGFLIGGTSPHSIRNVVLEVHYDNPNLLDGLHDSTGIRLGYTSQLRPNNAAVMTIGDPSLNLGTLQGNIPPGSTKSYQADCPSECTSGWAHDITVVQTMPHMHQTGARIWTNVFDNQSNFLLETARSDFWDFAMQQSVGRDFAIHRGDRLNTHCIYNTSNRAGETNFGEGSEQEMCMEFLTYYPALFTASDRVYSFCGISPSWGEPTLRSVSVCGNFDQYGLRYDLDNPFAWEAEPAAKFGLSPVS